MNYELFASIIRQCDKNNNNSYGCANVLQASVDRALNEKGRKIDFVKEL